MYVATKHSAVWMGIGLDIFDRLAVYVYGLPLFLLIACYMYRCRLDSIRLVAMVTWHIDKSTRRQMNLRVNYA